MSINVAMKTFGTEFWSSWESAWTKKV